MSAKPSRSGSSIRRPTYITFRVKSAHSSLSSPARCGQMWLPDPPKLQHDLNPRSAHATSLSGGLMPSSPFNPQPSPMAHSPGPTNMPWADNRTPMKARLWRHPCQPLPIGPDRRESRDHHHDLAKVRTTRRRVIIGFCERLM